jgi:hypothetical protein
MNTRLPYPTLAPEPYQAMLRLESAIARSGLERASVAGGAPPHQGIAGLRRRWPLPCCNAV